MAKPKSTSVRGRHLPAPRPTPWAAAILAAILSIPVAVLSMIAVLLS